ncbi:cyclic nucleotide-binding domain-containing protein [Mariprofundus sp. NF]|uniref:Crp/Fnr family transcriptional regulator n=1 Tax=Mariprofundus sp. NF TaxID=2608716 RepID=UPI0015A2CF61|nr:cyclic nucleotide-binding domain-containing protein [Mariprofundus sp. NF]NWF38010.1 cyclic nucleotide-binding domain-containing protein [Mariprofundus sp. NF]
MDDARLELLQSMPVFGGVSQGTLIFLMQRASILNLEKGEFFFHEGDSATSMFVLESGVVAAMKQRDGQELVARELGQGDCFGEMALLDLYPRSASVIARTHCRAIEISQASLFALHEENLEQFTIIQMNIGREISRRLRLSDEKLFEMSGAVM